MKKICISSVLVFVLLIQPVFADTDTATTDQTSLLEELKSKLEQLLALFNEPPPEAPSAPLAVAAVTAGTGVGQRAQLKTSASSYSIRASMGNGAKVLGNQPKSSLGTVSQISTQTIVSYPPDCNEQISAVIAGITCTPTYTKIDWARVNFDTGVDGWIEKKYLVPAASTKFNVDTSLIVTTQTTIRSSPNGSSVGTQKVGSVGVIKGTPVSSGGKIWWPVDFSSGTDGWTDAGTINNFGVELPNRNLSIIEIPTPVPTTLSGLQPYANLAGVDVNTLKDVTDIIKDGSYSVVADNGTVAIVELTPKGATEAGLNQGAMFMFGADDEGNFEVAVIDPLNTAFAIRVNDNDPFTQTWTIRDEVLDKESTYIVNYINAWGDDFFITISELNYDGTLDIIVPYQPIGQIDASNIVWKMPDICSDGCTDMPEFGFTAQKNSDGKSGTIKTGQGASPFYVPPTNGHYPVPHPWEQFCSINNCPPPDHWGHKEKYGSAVGYAANTAFYLFETMGL